MKTWLDYMNELETAQAQLSERQAMAEMVERTLGYYVAILDPAPRSGPALRFRIAHDTLEAARLEARWAPDGSSVYRYTLSHVDGTAKMTIDFETPRADIAKWLVSNFAEGEIAGELKPLGLDLFLD